MAKEVVWTLRAQNDRKAIFEYWTARNKSRSYSIKLNLLFEEASKFISHYPEIGKPTSDKNVRVKIIKDFLMFYEIVKTKIVILTIWDNRQNPKNLIL